MANLFNLWADKMKTPFRISLLALALAPAVGGCTFFGQPSSKFDAIDPTPTGSLKSAALSQPPIVASDEPLTKTILALPADAGASGRLTEHAYANGWRQSVSLGAQKTAGDWNDLTLDIQTDIAGVDRATQIPMDKPTEAGIRHEILSRFPQTPMRIVGRPMHNAFGPFGLAVGAAEDGTRCAYAWQWVDDIRAVKASKAGPAPERNFFAAAGRETPASIRMRICRKGVSADALAEWFSHLELTDMANIDRAAAAAREEARTSMATPVGIHAHKVAQHSDIIDPSRESLENALPRKPKVAAAAAPAPRQAETKAVAHAPAARPRHVAARRRIEPEQNAYVAAPAAQQPYLAPTGAAYAAIPAAAPAPAQQRLNPNLPAQAYRGPTPASNRDAAPQTPTYAYGGAQPRYLGQ